MAEFSNIGRFDQSWDSLILPRSKNLSDGSKQRVDALDGARGFDLIRAQVV